MTVAQPKLFVSTPRIPIGPVVVSYGGGVNTIALLVLLRRIGVTPRAIVMADPGSEWPETHEYRRNVMGPWLFRIGFPEVTIVRRSEEVNGSSAVTLAEECAATGTLPSAAYGWKRCSLKYKRDPQKSWLKRQPWAVAEWEAGRRLIKAIGYDAGEPHRIRAEFGDPWESKRAVPWYPVHEADMDREDCETLIRSEGLELPVKSACTFCPHNTIADWERLRTLHPDRFAEALAIEERASATIDKPEIIGLMRPRPVGKKQLRVWAATADDGAERDESESVPCECST